MADAQLATYQDLLEYGQILRHGGARNQEQADLRAAIHGAYSDIALAADWQYYDTEYRLQLNASYSTGSVAYDHTGHASGERALTLTSGTWPTWIANGRVRVDGVVSRVDRVSASSATILLDSVLNPGADIASGTTYSAYQSVYQLPADLLTIEDLFVEEGTWFTHYLEPSAWLHYERLTQHEGRPWGWTLMKDPQHTGRWAVFLNTQPSAAEPLGFIYRRRPRTLRYGGTESVARFTASGSAATTTVTSSTTLPQAMVGSILRIGTTSDYPTGLVGSTPFVEQHEIYAISGTTVTLKTPLVAAVASSTKCVATDPVDMSESMLEALKARFEYRLSRGWGEGKAPTTALGLADRELRVALERDSRVQTANRSGFVPFAQWMKRIGVTDG